MLERFAAAQELDWSAADKNRVSLSRRMAAVIGQVQEVDAAKEDWPQYVEWLGHSFVTNDITGKTKWVVLLIVIGPVTYKLLRSFIIMPAKPKTLNASPERLYLPHSQGGRGLMSCLLTWEREMVGLAAYLATIRDPIMVVVYKHLQLWVKKSSFSLLPSANKILQEAGSAVAFSENPPLSRKKVIRELQKAQEAQLVLKAASKQHQGKFMSDMRRQAALNETLSVRGLTKAQLRSTTEALILAAQDDCIYTRSFKVNCMGNAGDTHCRQCGEGIETVRHILSLYRPKGFNLYMERHDRALLAVYHDLCKHYGFEAIP